MARQIELKSTGEKMTFIKSTSDTNGQWVEIPVTLPASGEGPPTHRHVFQTEQFEAIEGKLGLDCAGEKIILEPGQSFTVPVNTLHRCYSIDGTEIKFKATFTPAYNIEYFLTEMFESSNRKNSKDPSPFDACFILQEAKGEYYLADIPPFVQTFIFPIVAWIGKFFGLIKARSRTT
jgi:mannose-6-phosphate isomerase-like protein (cupin superfamily)